MSTIIAFANRAGGTIVVGIEDGSKKIVGIENILDKEERISNIIADSISPRLVPSVEIMSFEGKDLLLIEVYISGLRPHFIFPMPGYSVVVLSEQIMFPARGSFRF